MRESNSLFISSAGDSMMGSAGRMQIPASGGILAVVNVLPITSRKVGRKVYPNEVLISKGTPLARAQFCVKSKINKPQTSYKY